MTKTRIHTIPSWILICIPAILFMAIGYHLLGPGISPDSVSYLSAAQSFRESLTFIGVDSTPLTNWPPLYPILLSQLNASILNYASILLSSFLLWKLLDDQPQRTLLTAIGIISFPMLKLTSMVWSEPIFICLLLSAIYFIKAYSSLPIFKNLLGIGILFALLCLQRYVGLFFAGTLICLAMRHRHSKLAVTAILSLLPLAVWFVRNHFIKSNTPFQSFIHWDNGAQNLLACFQLGFHSNGLLFLAWFGWLLVMSICIWFFIRALKKPELDWTNFLQTSIALYLMVVLNWTLLSPAEFARYLLPLFPLGILLCASYLSDRKWLMYLLLGVNLIALCFQSAKWLKQGAGGYATQQWNAIPVAAVVNELPNNTYLSNAPDLIYLKTGKRCPFVKDTQTSQTIIWIKQVDRQNNLYTELLDAGYHIQKDTLGIEVLTRSIK